MVEKYELNVCAFKTENGDFEYVVAQEFEYSDGKDDVEFVERGSAETLEDAVKLALSARDRVI